MLNAKYSHLFYFLKKTVRLIQPRGCRKMHNYKITASAAARRARGIV